MRDWYKPSKRRRLRAILAIFCVLAFSLAAVWLCGYLADALSSRRQRQALSADYHRARSEAPETAPARTPVATPTASPAATEKAEGASDQASDLLSPVVYPGGPYVIFDPAIAELRKTNEDIVAWLTVDGAVDDAVVLRDNSFYLTHDAAKEENVNGALFLDERTVFRQNYRPATFIVYGHNMKTGDMFGSLKKFRNASYFYQHAFVTFDTLYEKGTYVIFSAATIDVEDPLSARYVECRDLYSAVLS